MIFHSLEASQVDLLFADSQGFTSKLLRLRNEVLKFKAEIETKEKEKEEQKKKVGEVTATMDAKLNSKLWCCLFVLCTAVHVK